MGATQQMLLTDINGVTVNPLWTNLTHAYNADSNANDQKGSANGTLVGGTTYATGVIGDAFSFDGANDYMTLPDDTFSPSGDFSFSIWIKPSGLTGNLNYFSVANSTLSNYIVLMSVNNILEFNIANSGVSNTISNLATLIFTSLNNIPSAFDFVKFSMCKI